MKQLSIRRDLVHPQSFLRNHPAVKTCRIRPQLIVLLIALAAAPIPVVFAQETAVAAPVVSLTVTADRPDAMYKVGETATFTIEVREDNQPSAEGEVVCVFSKDGWQPQSPRKLALEEGKATVTGTLDEPGFLSLRVRFGKKTVLAGAGFDPRDIGPSRPTPDDFDAFWDEQKAALSQVAMESTLTPVDSPVEGVEVFDVQVECLGKPVSGYLGRPKDAKPKSLPAILTVHGAGVGSASLGRMQWAAREGGMLALDINAHGIPNGQPAAFYTELRQGKLKGYPHVGRQDREECYFKGMFLRVVRAIDFLTAQPEWDGKTLIVYGSSQGGFQAIAAAGLDARVSFICAGVPAGCDHTGSKADRISGWPKLVPIDVEGEADPRILQSARYFDCVNFAARAECEGAAVTVGLIDRTCPPTSVYAAFNALEIPKTMHVDVAASHVNTPAAITFMRNAVSKHIREMR